MIDKFVAANSGSLRWILEMAKKGIEVTPGAGDHPDNVFLYMLDCELKELEQQDSLTKDLQNDEFEV